MLCFHSLQTGKCIASLNAIVKVSNCYPFPFPSNGNADPKSLFDPYTPEDVSFHSLQTGTRIQRHWASSCGGRYGRVSIPFKREAYRKKKRYLRRICSSFCFYSLQTGKHIASKGRKLYPRIGQGRFPFPSNGKTEHKVIMMISLITGGIRFHSLQTGKRSTSTVRGL